jgi:ferric-dicitrate binding protein FerR (iron transport regulator)
MTPPLPDDPSSPGGPLRERLTAYLDGELSPAEARAVLAWLEAHPQALRDLEEHRRVWALLSEYGDEPVSPDFADRVLERGRVEAGTPATRGARLRLLAGGRGRAVAAAAAVVLVLGAGGLAARRLFAPGDGSAALPTAIDGVPSALLESDDVARIAAYSDDEFEALLADDPEALASAAKGRGG